MRVVDADDVGTASRFDDESDAHRTTREVDARRATPVRTCTSTLRASDTFEETMAHMLSCGDKGEGAGSLSTCEHERTESRLGKNASCLQDEVNDANRILYVSFVSYSMRITVQRNKQYGTVQYLRKFRPSRSWSMARPYASTNFCFACSRVSPFNLNQNSHFSRSSYAIPP